MSPAQILLPSTTKGMVHLETGLYMPPEVKRNVLGRCRVPVEGGGVCGQVFFKGQQGELEAHAVKCCAANAHVIHALRKSVAHPELLPWDTEMKAWIDENRDALIEGRKSV